MSRHSDFVRILHFSDIHAGLKEFDFSYLFDKRLFGRANQFFIRGHHVSRQAMERMAARLDELAYELFLNEKTVGKKGRKKQRKGV